jgi:hypothetical protein
MVSYSLLVVMALCFTTIHGTMDKRQYLSREPSLCFRKLLPRNIFDLSIEQRNKVIDAAKLICLTFPHFDSQVCGKYPPHPPF